MWRKMTKNWSNLNLLLCTCLCKAVIKSCECGWCLSSFRPGWAEWWPFLGLVLIGWWGQVFDDSTMKKWLLPNTDIWCALRGLNSRFRIAPGSEPFRPALFGPITATIKNGTFGPSATKIQTEKAQLSKYWFIIVRFRPTYKEQYKRSAHHLTLERPAFKFQTKRILKL